jgi:hypothetical protein
LASDTGRHTPHPNPNLNLNHNFNFNRSSIWKVLPATSISYTVYDLLSAGKL